MYINNRSLFAIAVATMFSMVGCDSGSETSTSTTVDKNNEAIEVPADGASNPSSDLPVYTVSMNSAYPPFEFIDTAKAETNGFSGFDVDLLNAVAERGQFSVVYKPYNSKDFDKITKAVEDGTVDMSASSIFFTPERLETFAFSDPYFTMPIYFVGLDNADMPLNVEEVKNKRISVDKENFVLDSILQKSFVPKGNEIVHTDTTFLAFQDVLHGDVDLMFENLMTINDYEELTEGVDLSYLKLPEEYSIQLGYITQKDNQDLINKLNSGLQAVLADGTYDKIYNNWFGDLEHTILDRTEGHDNEHDSL